MDTTHTHPDDIQMATTEVHSQPLNQPHQAYPQEHAPSEPQGDIHMAVDAHHEVVIKQKEQEPSGHMDVDMETAAEAALSSHANHGDSPMEQASSITASAHSTLPAIKQETVAEDSFIKQETMEDTPIKQKAMEETSIKQESTEDRLDAALESNDDKIGGYESSDLESSDDDDDGPASSESDSDSDSDDDIGKAHAGMTIEQRQKARQVIDAMDDDDSDGEGETNGTLHTAHEIVQLPEVTKPNVVIGPDTKLEVIGTVFGIVDNVVVVQANSSGDTRVLDSGTVVAVIKEQEGDQPAHREILGEIFETFGPVARPLYSIRFNTASEIPSICTLGSTVHSVPEYSSFVLTQPLKAMKGSDASNRFDEEVNEEEMEFSDDEKEMEHKRLLKEGKKKNRGGNKGSKNMTFYPPTETTESRPAGRTPIALPQRPVVGEMDDGYKILQRPGVRPQGSQPGPSAATGSVPWYQQQQRELQHMMGTPQPNQEFQKRQQQQFQQQQQLQQQLLLQKQQQQQLFQQQQQQQALYQKQIQEAQETIRKLQQQQTSLQQSDMSGVSQGLAPSQAFQFRAPQQMDPSFNIQQAQYQQQQPPQQQPQPQTIMNLLSPLFSQGQNQDQNGQDSVPK
ncbi:hypothetical protein BGZ82_004246 [Podila clonocystis]|nr:hypothetical protein BGZ82_004246 [Podila clonocystis]